jgi:hypothetical protein
MTSNGSPGRGCLRDACGAGCGDGAGEPACRPGSVRPLARGGDHPSGTAVADSLVRPTREHRAGRPQTLAQGTVVPLLALLRVGFTEPPQSPAALVVSYTTVSPLPLRQTQGRSVFCGTFPRVTPGRRYRPPCPVEPGPSSPGLGPVRPPGRLTQSQDTPSATSRMIVKLFSVCPGLLRKSRKRFARPGQAAGTPAGLLGDAPGTDGIQVLSRDVCDIGCPWHDVVKPRFQCALAW